MVNYALVINKARVFAEVERVTAYAAMKKAADGSLYTQAAAVDSDREYLERHWSSAVTMVNQTLSRYIATASNPEQPHGADISSNYTIMLSMPGNFPTTLFNTIKGAVFSFFVDYITYRWMEIAVKEESANYEKKAQEDLAEAVKLANHRSAPIRRVES